MKNLRSLLREIGQYPTAIFGVVVVLALVIAAIVVIIKIPYDTAISTWRGGEEIVYKNPKTVPPKWYNWFRKDKLVESLDLNEGDEGVSVTEETTEGGTLIKTYTFEFDFPYKSFPQDMVLYFKSEYESKQPFVSMKWYTPDEREIKVASFAIGKTYTYPFLQDQKLQKRLNNVVPNIGLFLNPDNPEQVPVMGTYKLVIETILFEPNSTVSPEFVLHGQVFGWAGTDHMRRDLILPLLWGIPIALSFGLLAALGTSLLTMTIAAFGTWFGGFWDALIQRITEVNMVLPFLSILIMVGTFYSRSIWTILGVTIALSIFTGGIKSYRAMFLQVKESTYIEAAKAYGARDSRIIFKYLIPRMIPLLLPGLISSVPSFVFLEASLAVLGIGDPVLPTWGKMINEALGNAALYRGWFYWILEPAVLLMITGLGFAGLGFALDRIFNPRLRGV
ncbi:MAG TPA: ABC transporter permease [Anaerolineaceae bacterium]|nr:ABC transporter permease [Anaerolineaceae bacterium]NMD31457.1 ABC transporter permease [Chloroflexota bacterium]HNZ00609.1 ABC transporter permease [Anaerolineaceae bacterium]HOD43360.1 ABC transporter permease [Anaerolineaceae bacterium]HOH19915.1 ABC transporter permease [Anaerolineaceae bacterium]